MAVATIHAVAPGLAHGVDTGLDPDQGQQVVQTSDRGVQRTVHGVEVVPGLLESLDSGEDSTNPPIMLLYRLPAFQRGCRLAHRSTRASLSHHRRLRPTSNQPVTSILSRRPSAFLFPSLLSQDNLTNSPASQSHTLRKPIKEANGRRHHLARPINTLSILNIQLLRRTLPLHRRHLRTSSRPVARWAYLHTILPHLLLLQVVPGRLRRRSTRINLLITMLSSISSINLSTTISLNSIRAVITKVIPNISRVTTSSRDAKESMEEEMDRDIEVVDGEVEELDEEITVGVEEGMEDNVVVRRGVVVGLDELRE